MMQKLIFLFCLFSLSLAVQGQNFDAIFKKYNVKGSVTIFDLNKKHWIFSDKKDAHAGSLPASTFKIVNSCIALQQGVLADENEILHWDGQIRSFNGKPVEAWNKDTNLKNAFKNSTVWFYVELAKEVGKKKYRRILQKINYGNGNLSEKGIDFWNYGNFKVTPVQQIEFLKNLYLDKLPFDKNILHKVKNIMISDSSTAYTVRSKTGWTSFKGKNIGWYIGYITTPENVYFFANRITKPVSEHNEKFNAARKDIVIEVLKEMNLIKE